MGSASRCNTGTNHSCTKNSQNVHRKSYTRNKFLSSISRWWIEFLKVSFSHFSEIYLSWSFKSAITQVVLFFFYSIIDFLITCAGWTEVIFTSTLKIDFWPTLISVPRSCLSLFNVFPSKAAVTFSSSYNSTMTHLSRIQYLLA